MKKPRKPKAKRAHAGKRASNAAAHARLVSAEIARERPRTVANLPATRVAAAPWSDEHEKLTLLLLPFFIMAFALGLSQAIKPAFRRPSEVAATAPIHVPVQPATRPADPLAAAPALALPRQAPAIPVPSVDDALARTAMLELPRRAPIIERPEVHIPSALALPRTPPAVEVPEIRIATPQMRVPAAPPDIVSPAPGPAAPILRLPSAPPLVATAPIDRPVLVAPPITRPSTPLPPLAQREDRPRPDICLASPSLGQHVYPLVARTEESLSQSTEAFGLLVSAAAIAQTEEFVIYNDKYRRIAFPMGDIATLFGVCTDVVIRAYRSAGVDLQELVHRSRVGSGDPSIAHRRTETLRRFFAAHGRSLLVSPFAEDYQPGDIVTYERPQNRRSRSHVAIVTDRIAPSGRPMIVHNRGWGPQLEDGLFVDRITGHYRFAPAKAAPVLEAARPTLKRPGAAQSRPLAKASYVQAQKTTQR